MNYQQTPQGLSTLFSLPPEAQTSGMGLLTQQQNADQMTQQDQARQLDFDTANDPLKLAHQGLTNQTLEAGLPEVVARSNMAKRKDANEALLNDDQIKDMVGKYKSADLQRHVTDMEGVGQLAQQQYQSIYMNPFGAAQRAKDAFTQAGHADLWNDDWNDLPAGQLAAKLKDFGQGIQQSNSAMSKALMQAQERADAAKYVADRNYDRGVDVAEIRKAQAIAAAARKPGENMSAYEARIRSAADAGDDAAKAQVANLEADKRAKAAAGATVKAEGDVDVNKLGGNLKSRGAPGGDLSKTPPAAAVPNPGVYKAGSPEAQSWIQRAMAANPGMTEDQVLKQGLDSGKIK